HQCFDRGSADGSLPCHRRFREGLLPCGPPGIPSRKVHSQRPVHRQRPCPEQLHSHQPSRAHHHLLPRGPILRPMIATALFAATVCLLAALLYVLQECTFLVLYRQLICLKYADVIAVSAAALLFSLF